MTADYMASIDSMMNIANSLKDGDAIQIQTTVQAIYDLAAQIQSGWIGDDALQYVNELQNYHNDLLQLVNFVGLVGNNLSDFALALQENANHIISLENSMLNASGVAMQAVAPTTAFVPVEKMVETLTSSPTSTADVTPTVEYAKEVVESEPVVAKINPVQNHSIPSGVSPVYVEPGVPFAGKSYQISEAEKFQLMALVAGEDGQTYDGALAVMSTILNRCESPKWNSAGGSSPLAQAKAQGQFSAWRGSTTKSCLKDPSQIPSCVEQAVNDALSGVRNHQYLSFRANTNYRPGRVQIGDNGNYYFGEMA